MLFKRIINKFCLLLFLWNKLKKEVCLDVYWILVFDLLLNIIFLFVKGYGKCNYVVGMVIIVFWIKVNILLLLVIVFILLGCKIKYLWD